MMRFMRVRAYYHVIAALNAIGARGNFTYFAHVMTYARNTYTAWHSHSRRRILTFPFFSNFRATRVSHQCANLRYMRNAFSYSMYSRS
jgi:hypothetical protein